MKLGLICEGVRDGADERTLRCLVRRIRPDVDLVILPQGKKPNLKQECGRVAKRLIDTDRCERVGIIWDLFPKWGRNTDCCQDHADVHKSLVAEGVNVALVRRLCVVAEIETWLLMDHRAIAHVISTPARPKTVSRIKDALTNTRPKDKLREIFRNNKVGLYREYIHNQQIAAAADLDRLRRCPSFEEFLTKVLP